MKTSLIFYLGTVLGSFLGLVSYRLPIGGNIIVGRSTCESCEKELNFYELIPIFSYLAQGGRCRSCGGKIGKEKLLVEVANGLLLLIFYKNSSHEFISLLDFFVMEILFLLALIDREHLIIPNKLSLLLFVLSLVKGGLDGEFLLRSGRSLIFISISLLLYLVSKKGFGMGDIKVFLSLIYFWPLNKFLLNLFLSLFMASIYSLVQIFRGKLKKEDQIPFAPFIFVGFLVSLYLGEDLIGLYKKIFF